MNNTLTTISLDRAKQMAPAIFATEPHARLSKDYKFTSSLELMGHLDDQGWKLTNAKQSKSKNANPLYTQYGTHIMEFQHPELYMKDERGDLEGRPTLVVINNHNGDRPLQIEAGLFRLVCSNGLIIKTQDFGSLKERHIKHTIEEVKHIVSARVNDVHKAVNRINTWSMKEMNTREQFAFATEALALRMSSDRKPEQYEIRGVLEAKRKEDSPNTLWHVFNRTQENLIRGGFMLNERQVRAIKNPMADFQINQDLWQLAEKYSN